MQVVYNNFLKVEKPKRLTPREIQHNRCIAMIAKQKFDDRKAALKKFAERIEKIKKPELPTTGFQKDKSF